MARKFFSIKIKPKDVARRIGDWRTKIPRAAFDRMLIKMEEETLRVMRSTVPVKTGRLRASIRVIDKKNLKGAFDMRGRIEVGSNLPYAKFVDLGTAPSPGRFVPILGRRLISGGPGFGMHPGVRSRNYIRATQLQMSFILDGLIEKFTNDWRRGLRL